MTIPEYEYDQNGIDFSAWHNVPQRDIDCYEWAANVEPRFPLPKEAEASESIPVGKLTQYTWKSKVVYPDVSGIYKLYVPQQYHGQEAALMVIMDGDRMYIQGAKMPNVLDTMIANGELPVSIAVFIDPGNPGPGLPRYGGTDHRSIEYDSIDDRYVTFLDKEILEPLRERYHITTDPSKSMICGISSSGNAAFAAAWHRPDLFGKVLSNVGSFTAIRGGDLFPGLIRQSPAKPIRVYLQTGEHDLNTCFGNWPLANQSMASALEYKSYDYKLEIGPGGHSIRYGASVMPAALRWLWR